MRNRFIVYILSALAAAGLFAWSIAGEQPTGTLRGTAVSRESGIALRATVMVTAHKHGALDYSRSFQTKADSNGNFTLTDLPVGSYMVSMFSSAHELQDTPIQIEESKTTQLQAVLKARAFDLSVYVHQHVYTPDEKGQITCSGFTDAKNMKISTYRVDLDQFLGNYSGDLRRLLTKGKNYGYDGNLKLALDDNAALGSPTSFDSRILNKDIEGVYTYRIDLPRMTPGLYVVVATAGKLQRADWIMFTSIGMVTKSAAGKLVTYTTDLKTGDPVAGAQVKVFSGGSQTHAASSNAEGLADLTLDNNSQQQDYDPESGSGQNNERQIAAFSGDSVALSSVWINRESTSRMMVYSYTDRPVYRPGQQVYFKGIARKSSGAFYTTPVGRNVKVEVRDPQDTLIYSTSTDTGKFGSYSASFNLPKDAATGFYTVSSRVDGQSVQESASFRIAEYRKPELKAEIKFDKKRYSRGETIRADISASYYFGSPVANAKVHYYIYRSDYWMYSAGDDQEEFLEEGYDSSDFGELVTDGTVESDESGRAQIEIPAIWPQPRIATDSVQDQQFTIDVRVEDSSYQEATAQGSTIATLGDFDLIVEPDSYVVSPGKKIKVKLSTIDYEQKPVSGVRVELIKGHNKWTNTQFEFVQTGQFDVTTDAQGKGFIEIEADKAGDLQLLAKARDSKGNRISESGSVWVYSDSWNNDFGEKLPDLKITTDKKIYNTGDVVTALIQTEKTGATALVSIEGDKIHDYYTLPLTSQVSKISVPVLAAYGSNFYISVCCVRNKNLVQQESMVAVSVKSYKLNVKLESDKQEYRPGETAFTTITATDSAGKPVVAEVSLGVVDESVYAIARDNTQPIASFFYSRKPNHVNTSFSFPSIYLSDPDKSGAQMKATVRRNFKDTAYWSPSVVTDQQGKAVVAVKLPDNLTSWVSTARAIDAYTDCGQNIMTYTARKPLMVRLQMPRFLTAGDKFTALAVVHNYSSQTQKLKVNLSTSGLKTGTLSVQTAEIAKDEDAAFEWPLSVVSAGKATVTVHAEGTSESDAMELTVPVLPHGVLIEHASAGALRDSKTANVEIPLDSAGEKASAKLTLQPTLASSLLSGLQFLANYPYGCIEQTASAFLPDIILFQNLKGTGMLDPWVERNLPDMVRSGVSRLQTLQLYNGSWGWGRYGSMDLWNTSYAAYALLRAKEAGFPVNPSIVDNAVPVMLEGLANAKISGDDRAFACYVLALAGKDATPVLKQLQSKQKLGPEGLAAGVLAAKVLKNEQLAQSMYNELKSAALSTNIHQYWSSRSKYDYLNVQATALGLEAMLSMDPKNPNAAKVVRWLMESRRGGSWYSTRDTAATLSAVSRYIAASEELKPNATVSIDLGSAGNRQIKFTAASLKSPNVTIDLQDKELQQIKSIGLSKAGSGTVYYTLDLQQYVPTARLKENQAPIAPKITRSYYKPRPRYFQTKSARDLGNPITSCKAGELVLIRLTVHSTQELEYLLLEDRLPAGLEAIDRGSVYYWDWRYSYVDRDIRDHMVSFYLEKLQPKRISIEYQVRAVTKGSFAARPAQLFGMYRPDVRSYTGEDRFTVR